jgi:hypothetical protein
VERVVKLKKCLTFHHGSTRFVAHLTQEKNFTFHEMRSITQKDTTTGEGGLF